ncbi:MAG TPA: hypothetical protein VGA53_04375 [Candidatus Paceibacterota bacterium]
MIKKILFVFVLLAVVAPIFAFAQINLNLDYPTFGGVDLNTNQNLNTVVAWLYYFFVGIAGLAAFVMIVWGGIQWLTSGAIPSQASEARDKLRAAILGLLLVLASFLIIQVINPQLTLLNQPGLTQFFGTNPTLDLPSSGGGGFSGPAGVTAPGIYLCRDINCTCTNPGNCEEAVDFNNPINPGGNDYVYIDPAAFPGGAIFDLDNSAPILNWGDEVSAIGIIGNSAVRANRDQNFTAMGICFNGGVADLKKYLMQEDVFFMDDDWNDAIHSIAFFPLGTPNGCQDPNLTLDKDAPTPGVSHFRPQPAVYLINKTGYGTSGNPHWTPVNYYWPNSTADRFNPTHNSIDWPSQYNSVELSVWITSASVCGSAGNETCAVKFYEDTDIITSDTAPDSTHQTICFNQSMPDLLLYTLPPAPDLHQSGVVKQVRAIPASQCPPAIHAQVQG